MPESPHGSGPVGSPNPIQGRFLGHATRDSRGEGPWHRRPDVALGSAVETLGLRTVYILFFFKLGTRHVHFSGRPHHPQTQGKIERYHRSMKSIVKLNAFFFPWELEQTIADFVAYYNYERNHESLNNVTLDNVTLDNVFGGRQEEALTQRDLTKQQILLERRQLHLQAIAAGVQLQQSGLHYFQAAFVPLHLTTYTCFAFDQLPVPELIVDRPLVGAGAFRAKPVAESAWHVRCPETGANLSASLASHSGVNSASRDWYPSGDFQSPLKLPASSR